MKKGIYLPIILFLLTNKLFSQTTDTLLLKELTKPVITCEIISLNSQRIITGLNLDQKDSIRKVLNIWENYCRENEPILRMRILLDISDNIDISQNFKRYFKQNKWQTFADKYKYRFYNPEFRYEIYPFNNYVPNGSKYDEITKQFAELLLTRQSKNSLAYLFCEFIKGDFEQYNKDICSENFKDNTVTADMCRRSVLIDYIYSVATGIWVPQGHLSGTFNENLLLSFSVVTPKFFKNNFLAETKFSVRVPFNKPTFVFTADDSVYTANNNTGFNFSVNMVYETQFENKNYLRFFSGIGFDLLNTGVETKKSRESNSDEKSYWGIGTFSIPFGVGIRRNLSYQKTTGFDLSYNYTPYNIDKKLITNLSGNYITANIFFGF